LYFVRNPILRSRVNYVLIVFHATRRIHLDNSIHAIMEFQRHKKREFVYYDAEEHDLLRFDIIDRKSKKRVATVQISPNDKVNLYIGESRSRKQVNYVMNQLHKVILDDSKAGVELKPMTVLYRMKNMYPLVLRNFILELDLPISLKPMPHQIKMSTIKIGRRQSH